MLKGRYVFMIGIMMITAGIFTARLVQWQIVQSDYYGEIASASTTYTVQTDSIRGEIYDVNGEELAVNITGYKVVINKLYIKEEELNNAIIRLIRIMEECGESWTDELPIITGKDGKYAFDKEKEEEVERLKDKDNLNMNPYATAEDCMEKLTEKYDCRGYNSENRRDIISVRYNMEKMGYSKTQPYTFAQGIKESTMAVVAEKMQDIQGVTTESTVLRTYKNGTLAPHIVGVTGLISAQEYEELKDKGYGYTDKVGKSGIERAFEDYLRGKGGSRTYGINSEGKAEIVSTESARPGDCVYLTIDNRYQAAAQKALKEAVEEARQYSRDVNDKNMGSDCSGAAAVVLNVKDFSVLCAASYPSYDIERYYEDYTKLAGDKTLPLFDRAFMGALAPGSTFKPLVASAALEEKKITTQTYIDCEGVYTTGGLHLWCMGYHGNINVYEAIEHSCNVFFAETGRLLGIENMEKYAKRCGLGVKTGVEISESAGTLAGIEFSQQTGSQWYESFVSPAAIGQSDNQFTPLQLATYTATIANNGVRLKTHIVDKVVSYSEREVIFESKSEITDNMGVSEKNLKEVQKAMNMAANSYETLSDLGISVAGKTGTAENSGSDHANFICYAPYENPEIAVCVMVEHGAKSFVAMNVAKKIMKEYFSS